MTLSYRGSYYDPSNVFCGKHDCYKILGFDYEYSPDKKELTQSYRELSKKWHPDKNKDKKANARFMVSEKMRRNNAHIDDYAHILNDSSPFYYRKSTRPTKSSLLARNVKNMTAFVTVQMNTSRNMDN